MLGPGANLRQRAGLAIPADNNHLARKLTLGGVAAQHPARAVAG